MDSFHGGLESLGRSQSAAAAAHVVDWQLLERQSMDPFKKVEWLCREPSRRPISSIIESTTPKATGLRWSLFTEDRKLVWLGSETL